MLSVKKEIDKLKELTASLNNISLLIGSIHRNIGNILRTHESDSHKKIIALLQKLNNRLRDMHQTTEQH